MYVSKLPMLNHMKAKTVSVTGNIRLPILEKVVKNGNSKMRQLKPVAV